MLSSTFLGIVPILFGLGCATVKEAPRQVSGGGIYTLYGAYCYRNHFDDTFIQDSDLIYTYIDYNTTDYVGKVNFYEDSDSHIYNTTIRTFEIIKQTNHYQVHLFDGDISLNQDIYYGDYVSDLHEDSASLVLFFPQPLNVSANGYKLFNCFFTNEGNDFVTSYSGWYTFTNTNLSFNYSINGFFTVNNNLYNNLEYIGYNCTANLYGLDTFSQLLVIDNKVLQVDNSILLNNVLIPYYTRDTMTTCGVFAYVYEPVEYTFGDMVFSVMDAPVYMLSQLFSFELFGLQFYVAFMGIVTVVLICFVLKKII